MQRDGLRMSPNCRGIARPLQNRTYIVDSRIASGGYDSAPRTANPIDCQPLVTNSSSIRTFSRTQRRSPEADPYLHRRFGMTVPSLCSRCRGCHPTDRTSLAGCRNMPTSSISRRGTCADRTTSSAHTGCKIRPQRRAVDTWTTRILSIVSPHQLQQERTYHLPHTLPLAGNRSIPTSSIRDDGSTLFVLATLRMSPN